MECLREKAQRWRRLNAADEKTKAWGERKTERLVGGCKRKLLHLNDEKQRLSHRGGVECVEQS